MRPVTPSGDTQIPFLPAKTCKTLETSTPTRSVRPQKRSTTLTVTWRSCWPAPWDGTNLFLKKTVPTSALRMLMKTVRTRATRVPAPSSRFQRFPERIGAPPENLGYPIGHAASYPQSS